MDLEDLWASCDLVNIPYMDAMGHIFEGNDNIYPRPVIGTQEFPAFAPLVGLKRFGEFWKLLLINFVCVVVVVVVAAALVLYNNAT